MNITISIGRLTAEPDISTTASGKKVAKFSLALQRMKEGADYPRFIAWEKKAELIENHCHKGTKLGVKGHIQTGSYDGKDGKVYTTDVIVDEIEFCEKKAAGANLTTEVSEDGFMNIPEGVEEEVPFA